MFQYDYDKVYFAMTKTLDELEVEYDADGIDRNIEQWAENKGRLVELLRKHPDWNEDALAIITKEKVCRTANVEGVEMKCCKIHQNLSWKYDVGRFVSLAYYAHWASPKITSVLASEVSRYDDVPKPVVGQKTTRYLRQLFLAWGVVEDDKAFWDLFQELADLINADGYTERNLIISVNPADYLSMSYGTNWASCHILNPAVARTKNGSDYHGEYKGGCLSYLGDESSIITYTVDELPEEIERLPYTRRQTRQMFFVNINDQAVMQSRLYPYTNDMSVIEARRTVLQGVLAQCFSIENKWDVRDGYANFSTGHGSLQYRDYDFSCNHITTSWPQGHIKADTRSIIGGPAYCLNCGERVDEHDSVHCYDCGGDVNVCYSCGEHGDDDEMHWIDGELYCEDCCRWCDYHEEWELSDDDLEYIAGYGSVCRDALEYSGLFFYDDDWEEWLYTRRYPDYIQTSDGTCFRDAETAIYHDYYPCRDCDEWHYGGDMYTTLEGEELCDRCYRYNSTAETCPHCGVRYNTDCDEVCPNCGVVVGADEAV